MVVGADCLAVDPTVSQYPSDVVLRGGEPFQYYSYSINRLHTAFGRCSAQPSSSCLRIVLWIFEERDLRVTDPIAVQRLADAMAKIGEATASIPVLEQIVANDQADSDARLRLAESLRETGQFTEAEYHYRKLLESQSQAY